MVKKRLSKSDSLKEIEGFFEDIKNKSPKEILKIKRLAMANNIKLGNKRRTFCKKCFNPYKNPKIRIREGLKNVICDNCGYISRWKIK
ncbi:hypothetical protein K0A97_02870 [Patescibacteria group bacterium]|nr:hypothetical protein [Patescibacteria group bacterium]